MSYVRIRLVALVAVAAMVAVAVAASTASALPEFGQCVVQAKHEGHYTNNVCTKKAAKVETKFTGEFEWRKASEIEAAKRKVEGEGGTVVLAANYRLCESGEVRAKTCREGEAESTSPGKVTCESEKDKGELSGTKNLLNVTITLKGCKLVLFFSAEACSNTGTEGEITVGPLKGALGFISKKTIPREVGLQLNPTKKGGKFFTATCAGGFAVAVGQGNETEGCVYPLTKCGGDGVIATIGPVNTSSSAFTDVFSFNEAEAENVPSHFEGATKPLEVLESYAFVPGTPGTTMWSKAGLSLTSSEKTPEAIEIKAN